MGRGHSDQMPTLRRRINLMTNAFISGLPFQVAAPLR
jgi:hypothetical protein